MYRWSDFRSARANKHAPIVEGYRKFSWGKDAYEYWEYLVNEMARNKSRRDLSYKYNADMFTVGEYEKAFSK